MEGEQTSQTPQNNDFSENKMNLVAVAFAVLLVAGGFFFFTRMSGNSSQSMSYTNPTPASTIESSVGADSTGVPLTAKTTMDNKLAIEDQKVGTGDEATAGKKITVNYNGTLTDGTKFDSSYDHGTPFSFVLGSGQVIQGWDQGFSGMKVGGKRKLTIPPSMGYGDRGVPGAIPGGATLIFEVELLKVE